MEFLFPYGYSYDEWVRFNDGQRAHYNYLEAAPTVLALLLIGGTRAPVFSTVAGVTYIFGRELYAQGYAKKGPQARNFGAAIGGVSMISLLGAAIYSSVKVARLGQ